MKKKILPRNKLVIDAPAKINLFLKVGRLRKDGFHSLDTLFQEVSLCDQLVFYPTKKGISLRVFPARPGLTQNNLVTQALIKLHDNLKGNHGIRVSLKKHIPIGAGLGGGSSDAAHALIGGWILWKKPGTRVSTVKKNPPPLLRRLAAELGSDVSFFLRGGRARGRGKGEKLTSVRAGSPRWMILVYPRVHVSTPHAYRWVDQDRLRRKKSRTAKPKINFYNDFENPVMRRIPKIARVKQVLTELGCAPVLLSGSGSAVFGMVPNRREGQKWLRRLKNRPWDSFLVHTRHPAGGGIQFAR